MAFDFTVTQRVEDWRSAIKDFVRSVVIPREQDAFRRGVDDNLRRDLQQAAREAGIWAPRRRPAWAAAFPVR
jgi:acyl-CoA dehydrogenase